MLSFGFPEADPETRIPTKVKKTFQVTRCSITTDYLTTEHSQESRWEIKQGMDRSRAKGVSSLSPTSGQSHSTYTPTLISDWRKSALLRSPRISRRSLLSINVGSLKETGAGCRGIGEGV